MLKKFRIGALAALMTFGVLSVIEAAPSNDNQNTLCCRGNYCYNQSRQSDSDDNYCGGYCRNDDRNCW